MDKIVSDSDASRTVRLVNEKTPMSVHTFHRLLRLPYFIGFSLEFDMLLLVCSHIVILFAILCPMKAFNSNQTVAKNIRLFRLERGWSQEFCAEQCNLHRTYIGAVERGERNITLGTLDKIALALRTTTVDLLTFRGIK